MRPDQLAATIREKAAEKGKGRFIIALAGPPGAGKSTLAHSVAQALGDGAKVIPMDGFHFDDQVLVARGQRARKGAPETFDVAGFLHLMRRLRAGEPDVAIPVFDRRLELSRAGADIIPEAAQYLLVEGNYLLLNEEPWSELAPMFDLTVMLTVDLAELDRRLMARWDAFGKTKPESRAWIDSNDMPNIRRVIEGSRPADLEIAANTEA